MMRGRRLFLLLCTGLFFPILCCGKQQDVETFPDCPGKEDCIRAVADLYSGGKFEASLAAADSIIRADSLNDAAHYYRALSLIGLEQYPEAVESLQRAVDADSSNFWYSQTLVEAYLAVRNSYKASRLAIEMDRRFPGSNTSPMMRMLLAQGYLSQGNLPAFFNQAMLFAGNPYIAPEPRSGFVDNVLEMVDANMFRYWKPQLDSLVQTALAVDPADSSMLRVAGTWYYRSDRKEIGRQLFDKWLQLWPESIDARMVRLEIHALEKNHDAVVQDAVEIARLCPEKKVAMYNIAGDALQEQGKWRRCFSFYEKALKEDPQNAPVLNNYAYFLSIRRTRLGKAEKMASQAVGKDPDNAIYLDTLGWILHLKKRDSEAKAIFKRAMIHGGKQSSVILKHYAQVLETLGEDQLATYYRNLSESKK